MDRRTSNKMLEFLGQALIWSIMLLGLYKGCDAIDDFDKAQRKDAQIAWESQTEVFKGFTFKHKDCSLHADDGTEIHLEIGHRYREGGEDLSVRVLMEHQEIVVRIQSRYCRPVVLR